MVSNYICNSNIIQNDVKYTVIYKNNKNNLKGYGYLTTFCNKRHAIYIKMIWLKVKS